MSELVNTYLLSDPEVPIPRDRDEFYTEQFTICRSGGQPTAAVEIIAVFIFNLRGELFIQKRAKHKAHNPNLLDKSIGGHIQAGHYINYTAMLETVQELQVPSFVLRAGEDFGETFRLLESYLNTIAILKPIDTQLITLKRKVGAREVLMANKVHLFLGVYGGPVKTADNESRGALLYTLEDLQEEIAAHPDIFTYDIRYYLERYWSEFHAFRDFILSSK